MCAWANRPSSKSPRPVSAARTISCRGTLDRIVLAAPRLALVAGDAMIGLDIFFRNRGAETPRQYVILLGEIAALTTP